MNRRLKLTLISVAALILIAFLGWNFLLNPTQELDCTLNVPEQIASLPRTEFVSGPEAIQQIAMMHGKNISLDEGHIAKYKSGDKEVTLWISVSPSKEEGAALFKLMDEKMPASKVFQNRQEVKISSRKVVKVNGMGQEHYYWVSGKYNYWVAVAGTDGETIVENLILKVE